MAVYDPFISSFLGLKCKSAKSCIYNVTAYFD